MLADVASEELSTIASVRRVDVPDVERVFALDVIEGPDAGLSLVVEPDAPLPTLIGTSEACALRLSDRAISRRHASVEIVNGRLRVIDLHSTNGTKIQNVSIVEAHAQDGDLIRLGGSTVRVRAHSSRAVSAPRQGGFGRMIGASPEMRRLYPLCERIAAAAIPVVIEGETGTGKEVLAEALHEMGPRAQAPFVVFDCTAVPPSLVEAELFGHERGAFTGAVSARKGVFEQAEGGTLLIDEIGDLDLALQPKLLRAIERSEIRRIGGDRTLRVDVRVLSATRRDLDAEVQRGRFRDDLFHRLTVGRIELPPLRRRDGDVSVLARHFARQVGGDEHAIQTEFLPRWEGYAWPGNVRELRNKVARYVALGLSDDAASLATPLLPAALGGDPIERVLAMNLPLLESRQRVVDELEQRYIARVLASHGGHVGKAAAASGIARRHFQRIRARSGE